MESTYSYSDPAEREIGRCRFYPPEVFSKQGKIERNRESLKPFYCTYHEGRMIHYAFGILAKNIIKYVIICAYFHVIIKETQSASHP